MGLSSTRELSMSIDVDTNRFCALKGLMRNVSVGSVVLHCRLRQFSILALGRSMRAASNVTQKPISNAVIIWSTCVGQLSRRGA